MQVHGPLNRLASALKATASIPQRLTLAALLALSIMLLVFSKADTSVIRSINNHITDASIPALWMLRQPIAASSQLGQHIGEILAVYDENIRLKKENQRLASWQAEAVRLEVQNRSLRNALAMPTTEQPVERITARIIADPASPFVHTRLIDAGSDQGINPGMAVVTKDGMIGRITATGTRSSRVLLVTDFNSRVPIITESSGDQALLHGDNSPQPFLQFLPLNPHFVEGDRVLTSGRGGVLPQGLIVGKISQVSDHRIAVRPTVDWEHLDYVSILLNAPIPAPAATPLNVPLPGLVSLPEIFRR